MAVGLLRRVGGLLALSTVDHASQMVDLSRSKKGAKTPFPVAGENWDEEGRG
jgi:hypothetical protein